MRLDQVLVLRHLSESRSEAQELIASGSVIVNGETVTKQTRNIKEDDVVTVTGTRTFVGRGGLKLQGAFLHIYGSLLSHSFFDIKRALDIGSSTGGFTDCLLRYGAKRVVAVDVGTSQLHINLRNNPYIEVHEQTDIRDFITEERFDIVVVDLSFIQLDKILTTIISFGIKGTEYFLLIKPQFEVGKGNTKKGIVKDSTLIKEILQKYTDLAEQEGLLDIEVFPCSLPGGDGNQEYFLYGKKK